MRRAAFWVVFLLVAAVAFAYIWTAKDPLRNHPYLLPLWIKYNVRLMAHPHPEVAYKAWLEVWNLYFTKWAVFDTIPEHLANTQPISFLIERESFPQGGNNTSAMEGFFARDKPVYYKTDRVCCRTVSEALMAIMHREKKWTVDYQGDWQAWWQANAKYYR